MSLQTSDFNPYQPPTEGPAKPSLAADTEFLFNDKVVAGTGTIKLPKICVVTGETHDLVSQETRLWWCSRWVSVPRNLLVMFSIFSAIPYLVTLRPKPLPLTASAEFAFDATQLLAMATIAGAATLITASAFLRKSAQVHWSLARRIAKRHRLACAIGLLACLVAIPAISVSSRASGIGLIVAPALIGTALSVLMVRGKNPLLIIGEHQGLLLLSGLSPAFFTEIQRLIGKYNVRQSTPNHQPQESA